MTAVMEPPEDLPKRRGRGDITMMMWDEELTRDIVMEQRGYERDPKTGKWH